MPKPLALDETPLAGPELLAARLRVSRHVVHRAFPSETVVLNLQTGQYHGLNPVAGRMLEEIDSQDSVAQAARVIADEYGQALEDVERDICELCRDLARRGLVSVSPGGGH